MAINSYYFSFVETGCEPVDKILSEVASAGKAFHHTQDWHDPWGKEQLSPSERIQRAADEAAKLFESKP